MKSTKYANKDLQLTKQKEENGMLQEAMQTAASDASKEIQSKEKRIHQLEKKVGSRSWKLLCSVSSILTSLPRSKIFAMRERPRLESFQRHSNILAAS